MESKETKDIEMDATSESSSQHKEDSVEDTSGTSTTPEVSDQSLIIEDSKVHRENDQYLSESSDSETEDINEYLKNLHKNVPLPTSKPPTAAKTKGELLPVELPPVEDLQITEPVTNLQKIGKVLHTDIVLALGILVVVESDENSIPLDIGSVLFLSSGEPLGKIDEVFGSVNKPSYLVRFNKVEDIHNKGVKKGQDVFYSPSNEDHTHYVLVNDLKQQKGSDASWKDNNEPPDDQIDYSDDEQEKLAKRKRRAKNRKNDRGCDSEDDEVVDVTPNRKEMRDGASNQGRTFPKRARENLPSLLSQASSSRPSPRRSMQSPHSLPQNSGSSPQSYRSYSPRNGSSPQYYGPSSQRNVPPRISFNPFSLQDFLSYSQGNGQSPQHFGQSNGPTPQHFGQSNGPSPQHFGQSNGPSPQHFGQSNGPSPQHFGQSNGPSPQHFGQSNGPSPQHFGQSNGPSPPPFSQSNGPSPPPFGPFSQSNGPSPQPFGPFSQSNGPSPQPFSPFSQRNGSSPRPFGSFSQSNGPFPQPLGSFSQRNIPSPTHFTQSRVTTATFFNGSLTSYQPFSAPVFMSPHFASSNTTGALHQNPSSTMPAPQNNVPLQQQFMLQSQRPVNFLSHPPPNYNANQNPMTFLHRNTSFTPPTFGALPTAVHTATNIPHQSFARANGPHNNISMVTQPTFVSSQPCPTPPPAMTSPCPTPPYVLCPTPPPLSTPHGFNIQPNLQPPVFLSQTQPTTSSQFALNTPGARSSIPRQHFSYF